MKKFEKLLLFIISIFSLAISIGMLSFFYNIPLLTAALREYLILYPWLTYVFAIFVGLLCFCFLLMLLISILAPNKLSAITLKKNTGKLRFSKQALESTIRYSYANIDVINFSRIKTKLNRNPEKTKIYVKFSLKDPSNMVDLTTEIQERIESSIKASFGISVKMIYLEVDEVDPNRLVSDDKNRNRRVI